jgi:hypothetical protein
MKKRWQYLSISLLMMGTAACAFAADPTPGTPLIVTMGQRKPVRIRVARGQATLIRLPEGQRVMIKLLAGVLALLRVITALLIRGSRTIEITSQDRQLQQKLAQKVQSRNPHYLVP